MNTLLVFLFLISLALEACVDGFVVGTFRRPLSCRAAQRNSDDDDDDDDEPDLFEYFDPLLSPHAYPDGISPQKKPIETRQTQGTNSNSPPLFEKKKAFGFNLASASGIDGTAILGRTQGQKGAEQVNTDVLFDPRISPHEYPNGTPDRIFGFGTTDDINNNEQLSVTRVGILLMDHGSRNSASNDRLRQVARVYEESLNDPNFIVRHAHMEIAQPSIPEALASLLEEGVDEIVCHPYFLSPGRHVQQDIPQIVQAAMERLEITIPVVTTEPVGSETDIMIRAIHSAVKRTAAFT